MKHLLIVEDNLSDARKLADKLHSFGYQTTVAHDYTSALAAFNQNSHFDLVLLDVVLGNDWEPDGLDVCQKIRARPNPPPIIMLTQLGNEADVVKGLDMGARDYIIKPYSDDELRARIRNVWRTLREIEEAMVEATQQAQLLIIDEQLQIDLLKRKVFLDSVEVDLTRREFDLLRFLADPDPDKKYTSGQIFTRDELLDKVWGQTSGYEEETVTRHITSLRGKLHDDSRNPRYIFTERGVGYKFLDYKSRKR